MMMEEKTKRLVFYVAIFVFIGALAFLVMNSRGHNNKASVYSASALMAAENSFDFKTISMQNGKVSHEFELKNKGTEPVKIERVYTSCMCTTASIIDSAGKRRGMFGMPGHGLPSRTNVEIGPGESIVVEAIFDPAAHGPSGVGFAQRSIYLETNSQVSPKVELSFSAMVIR